MCSIQMSKKKIYATFAYSIRHCVERPTINQLMLWIMNAIFNDSQHSYLTFRWQQVFKFRFGNGSLFCSQIAKHFVFTMKLLILWYIHWILHIWKIQVNFDIQCPFTSLINSQSKLHSWLCTIFCSKSPHKYKFKWTYIQKKNQQKKRKKQKNQSDWSDMRERRNLCVNWTLIA